MKYEPDFKVLRKVLLRDGIPSRVPLYEMIVDGNIIKNVMGHEADAYTTISFFYNMGYDFVATGYDIPYKRNSLVGDDNVVYPNQSNGLIENREDFDNYDWPIISTGIFDKMKKITQNVPNGMKAIMLTGDGILENVMLLMGYEPFSYALYEDEQLIFDIFEKIGEIQIKAIKAAFEEIELSNLGAVVMGDDMGFNTGTMISPNDLRKYVFPWHKRIIDLVHDYDLPFILHSCGKIDSVMEDLIGMGIDAKHSYEDKIMPVTEMKKYYGDKVSILGGIDVNVLCQYEELNLREYVRNTIKVCSENGGFALGSGNSIAKYVPIENYRIMIDECNKFNERGNI